MGESRKPLQERQVELRQQKNLFMYLFCLRGMLFSDDCVDKRHFEDFLCVISRSGFMYGSREGDSGGGGGGVTAS